MRSMIQSTFAEPGNEKELRDEPLVIHQREAESRASHLVIFVHGLGGKRYGEDATWGDFPRFLYESFPTLDVGLYSFRTLFRRLVFWRSIRLEDEAEVLAGLLRSLGRYKGFILFGHSMGGLLCKCAVAHLVTAKQEDVVKRVKGLFLMASPQLGATGVILGLSWLTKDFQALAPHGAVAKGTTQIFEDHIHTGSGYPTDSKLHLPTWGLLAAEDFWVDPLSAGIGLPSEQKMPVRGTHTEIVKPSTPEADSFRFIRACIEGAILGRDEPFRRHECFPAVQSDFLLIHQLATQAFPGSPVSDLERMRQWWRVNNRIFWMLRRVTVATGYRDERVVGYFCVLPLTPDAARKICSGEITGATLVADHLVPASESAETFYIGAIVGCDQMSRGAALHYLSGHFNSLAEKRSITVLARPATEDGLRTINGYGMTPIEGSGRPGSTSVYRYELGPLLNLGVPLAGPQA